MYDELVKRLRKEAGKWCANCCYKCGDNVCGAPDDRKKDCDVYTKLHAADVIEEISEKRTGTWHRIKATQRSYSFVCNTCGKVYPHLTKCCPFCGVEYIDEEPSKTEFV